jgi:hypothetical protein
VARPIVLWPETDVAVWVATLVIVAERVTPRLSRRLIEPAAEKHSPSRLDPHHCRARAAVLNCRRTFEAGLHPVVDIALA